MVGIISQRVREAVSRLGQGEGSQQAQEVDFQRGQVVAALPVLGEAFRQVPEVDYRQDLAEACPLDPAAAYQQALVADCRPAQVVEDQPVHVGDCRGGRPVDYSFNVIMSAKVVLRRVQPMTIKMRRQVACP